MTTLAHTDSLEAQRKPLLQIRPPRRWAALDLKSIWRFRDLLLSLAARDVKLRYKQTALGVVWVIFQPVMAAGIFAFVFGTIAKMPSEGQNYFLFSYSGLLAWNLFNNTVTKSSMCLVGNSQLISKIFFPRLVLPMSTVPSSLIDFTVALAMMAVLLFVHHVHIGLSLLLLPVWISMVLLLASGIGLWTAALTVRYRDVQYILPVLLQLFLYASPISYSAAAVPKRLINVYYFNPLVAQIEAFRWSLLGTAFPEMRWLAYSVIVSGSFFLLGVVAFKRMEREFADVI